MQVASSSDPIPTSVPWQNDAPHRPGDDRRADWPAGPADDTTESVEAPALSRQACDAQLSTSFPPRLPGLLTSHDRSGSEELTLQETESSRASSRIPAHSVLSRMLQEGSSHGAGAEEDQAAAWLPPDMLQQGMLDVASPCGSTCIISAALPGRQPLYMTCQAVAGAILMLMHISSRKRGGGGVRLHFCK